mmetsp:Transcript_22916/g.39210  ORF Transcript_22916/g.39210 Transcript_22916/m.39210 type:complete len:526 (-) Transcript_22916:126-1703(-)
MAKSKRTRREGVRTLPKNPITNIELTTQETIDQHWDQFPPKSKEFILQNRDRMSLSKLIKFWSSPNNIDYTNGNPAGNCCGVSWYLSLEYLKIGMLAEARALAINGFFFHQLFNSSHNYIKTLDKPDLLHRELNLPYFIRGLNSTRSPEMLGAYIRSYLPPEYTHMMTSLANLASKKHVMGFIDQISDDWKGTSSASRNAHHGPSSASDDVQIKLILVDYTNEDERHSFETGSTIALKVLFNDYAEKRGSSLRSLRFSYAGKTLFLSSAGSKSPNELGMKDQDVIVVHHVPKPQEASDDDKSPQKNMITKKAKKLKSQSSKRIHCKSKKTRRHKEQAKTVEEHMIDHSIKLTKLHEEAEISRFKQIRQCLNNLVIERSQPKAKPKYSPIKEKAPTGISFAQYPTKEGIGGKAGKSRYVIQVGEVQNLYKTTKPSTDVSNSKPSMMSELDLHGCTSKEALARLNENLKVWVDTAMQGSYPFVKQAVIVCGCGNQILSEVVENWIRENKNVAKSPRMRALMPISLGH